MQRILTTVFFAITCFASISAMSAEEVRKLATEPRRSNDIGGAQSIARLDFRYGDINAWLLEDGNWHIEGSVTHRGAFCAQYQLGIQFGIGSPGCANVKWLGRPAFVTQRRHCNNAQLNHSGGDINYTAAELFEEINCAQRLIRCSGNCK
jgi:hypothetical protein